MPKLQVTDASDTEKVVVSGLVGKEYIDKAAPGGPVKRTEDRKDVSFGTALVDSVYLNTDPEVILEVGTGAGVSVENTAGFKDHVIWCDSI